MQADLNSRWNFKRFWKVVSWHNYICQLFQEKVSLFGVLNQVIWKYFNLFFVWRDIKKSAQTQICCSTAWAERATYDCCSREEESVIYLSIEMMCKALQIEIYSLVDFCFKILTGKGYSNRNYWGKWFWFQQTNTYDYSFGAFLTKNKIIENKTWETFTFFFFLQIFLNIMYFDFIYYIIFVFLFIVILFLFVCINFYILSFIICCWNF